jgi:hypothetical protein
MKITKNDLATLLKQAQKAHHEYEQSNEKSDNEDDDWADWYASYIKDKLSTSQEADDNLELDES